MILNDQEIRRMIGIDPFCENEKRRGKISYGVSSFGYDIRVANEFRLIRPWPGGKNWIDPKQFEEYHAQVSLVKDGEFFTLPPHGFVLAKSVECITMPSDALAICVGKSTYARCGIICNVTPLEPAWRGYITLELSNTTDMPARIYAGEGIAQLVFYKGSRPAITYAEKKGKYQDQVGIVLPKVD